MACRTCSRGASRPAGRCRWTRPPTGFARYANGDAALLYNGTSADQPGASGLLQRVVDPDLYDPGPASDRVVLPWRDSAGVIGSGGSPSRAAFDIQPQTLPVVFLPGFLGSQISCGGDELWPDMPFPALTGMNLTSNGDGNFNCAAAGPTGELVETVLGSDVYKSTADWLRGGFDASRLTLFGWDWRKAPQRLVRAPGRRDHGRAGAAGAVEGAASRPRRALRALYGGLLIRSFIEGPAARGSRVS